MAGYEVIGEEEKIAVTEIFDKGGGVLFRHGFDALRNNSFQVRDFELEFSKYMRSKYSLAVSSGTAALRVALASIGLTRGDEVVTQAFTFVATVEAIIESGGIPVCTEIDDSLNMCPEDLIKKITPKTKAVIVVHMLGTAANMDEIIRICQSRNLILIEDTAWGCGGEYDNKKLGTLGDIGCFSFDFAKTITTGEGGMLVFKDSNHHSSARAYHDHGHDNNPKFPRWEDTRSSSGFNYRMSELQGAIGRVQLKKLDYILEMQRKNAKLIKNIISLFPQFVLRTQPVNSMGTEDAVIFRSSIKNKAITIRKILGEYGIPTKILPEATTWHFAGDWSHIFDKYREKPKDSINGFEFSRGILQDCVSIPNGVKIPHNFCNNLESALTRIVDEIDK